MLVSKSISNG